MKRKLIVLPLITVLVSVFLLGNSTCTTPVTEYTLIVNSTPGGSVTTDRRATYFTEGERVILRATPDSGYHFVHWIGDVDTIANVDADRTTIMMNSDYLVTAVFDEVSGSPLDPFSPHLLAGTRPPAYMKAVTLEYMNNLLAWGDSLFAADTKADRTTIIMIDSDQLVMAVFWKDREPEFWEVMFDAPVLVATVLTEEAYSEKAKEWLGLAEDPTADPFRNAFTAGTTIIILNLCLSEPCDSLLLVAR